jgi:hypothetical protein
MTAIRVITDSDLRPEPEFEFRRVFVSCGHGEVFKNRVVVARPGNFCFLRSTKGDAPPRKPG